MLTKHTTHAYSCTSTKSSLELPVASYSALTAPTSSTLVVGARTSMSSHSKLCASRLRQAYSQSASSCLSLTLRTTWWGCSSWLSLQWRLVGLSSRVRVYACSSVLHLYSHASTLVAIVFVVFPPINFVSSLVIAACLTPTDPIISAAIVGKGFSVLKWLYALNYAVGGKFATKHVPLNLRRILSAESAANDGLAYPFLSISIYLTVETSRRVAFEEWFLVGWLCEYSRLGTPSMPSSPQLQTKFSSALSLGQFWVRNYVYASSFWAV